MDEDDRYDSLLTTQALLHTTGVLVEALVESMGMRIWVDPTESIQAAIDDALPGATIYIIPGIYRETIEITKPLTLTLGWSQGIGDDQMDMGVVIQPRDSQDGIVIRSQEPIQVSLRLISIQNAETGVSVSGNARVMMESVTIGQSVTGMSITADANVELTTCRFDGNAVAILATGNSQTTMVECSVDGSTGSVGAVIVGEGAEMSMHNTHVTRSSGSGIVLTDESRTTITEGYIQGNSLDGILLAGQASLHMTNSGCYSNYEYGIRAVSSECSLSYLDSYKPFSYEPFSGEVSGGQNVIPERGSTSGNERGSVCPAEELEFLNMLAN